MEAAPLQESQLRERQNLAPEYYRSPTADRRADTERAEKCGTAAAGHITPKAHTQGIR